MTASRSEIYSYAQEAGARWPELVAAQWQLESGSGKYTSGVNNFFGLKGPGSNVSTQEFVNGRPVTIKDDFLNFDSPRQCVQYLVDRWYKDYKGYKGVNGAASAEDAARMLQSEGYATDPSYADKLVRVMSSQPSQTEYADLVAAVESYKGLAHQKDALRKLQASFSVEQRKSFTQDWRRSATPDPGQKPGFPLAVPCFHQLDSKTSHAERMCFSSSMAMALDYLDPNAIVGDDDWYLRKVLVHGDTVSSEAQVAAARSLGFEADFKTNGSEKDLIRLLDKGVPVPVGILHKGHVDNPTGGGHWITLIGYDKTHFWVNDPRGDLDLVNGDYPSRTKSGCGLRYTRKNLMKRWLISGPSDGWYVELGK